MPIPGETYGPKRSNSSIRSEMSYFGPHSKVHYAFKSLSVGRYFAEGMPLCPIWPAAWRAITKNHKSDGASQKVSIIISMLWIISNFVKDKFDKIDAVSLVNEERFSIIWSQQHMP